MSTPDTIATPTAPTVSLRRGVLVDSPGHNPVVLAAGTPVAVTAADAGARTLTIETIYGPRHTACVEATAVDTADESFGFRTTAEFREGRRVGAGHLASELACLVRVVADRDRCRAVVEAGGASPMYGEAVSAVNAQVDHLLSLGVDVTVVAALVGADADKLTERVAHRARLRADVVRDALRS